MNTSSLKRIPPDHAAAYPASDTRHVQITPGSQTPSRPDERGVAPNHASITPTILAASDDRVLLTSIVEQLGSQEYRVIEAVDGLTALELVRHHRPAVVVLDGKLGTPGGLEVCRRLRGLSDACVLMLTELGADDDRILALSIGADAVLDKPFSPKELAAWANVLVRRARRAGTPSSRGAIDQASRLDDASRSDR